MIHKVIHFLIGCDIFYENASLHNIAAGGVASPNVNVDEAEELGRNTVDSMVGKIVFECLFKCNRLALNMGPSVVRCSKDLVFINSQVVIISKACSSL